MDGEPTEVCILAAGIGSRMRSTRPKALQRLAGKPMLAHLLDTVATLEPQRTHVVIGKGGEQVQAAFADAQNVNWVWQREQLGTGHAVMQALPQVADDSRLLMLLGDAPALRAQTLQHLLALDADLVVLSAQMLDPAGYGRIIRDRRDPSQVVAIVEDRDASPQELEVREVNTGVMVARAAGLKQWLATLTDDNAQGEYLLTDIVESACKTGASVMAQGIEDPWEVSGVNDFSQLHAMERAMQHEQAAALMEQGVHILDVARFDLRGKLNAGRNVTIDVNVIIEGEVTLGDDVTLGPNVIVKDSVVQAGSEIRANSVVEGATVGPNCTVGPFARLRPGAELAEDVHVGNFVEVKKSKLGRGSKANHLAYLGDATIGEDVNIGAGTITCNYDGANKHETHIGDGAFIGSNASLVAPVKIGAGATVGAGSTITHDVEGQALAVGRGKQKAVADWQRPTKAKE